MKDKTNQYHPMREHLEELSKFADKSLPPDLHDKWEELHRYWALHTTIYEGTVPIEGTKE